MEQATGEVKTIFRGGNGCGNESVPLLEPRTLGIPGGYTVIIAQQVKMLPAEVNAPMAGTTAQNLHIALMGEIPRYIIQSWEATKWGEQQGHRQRLRQHQHQGVINVRGGGGAV